MRGYFHDHRRTLLGSGEQTFRRARAALRRWEMFSVGWVQLISPDTPIECGRSVALLIRHFGFWSLNATRIVYVIEEDDSRARRFGFGYGTLTDHAESGEERFLIEWNKGTDQVWYDLSAFSRPKSLLAILGLPLARYLQHRFGHDSASAMQRAVSQQ